ncbi:hypothetical protein GCM10007989_37720 [Devosia pacifica]|uniref:Murein endopeptidase K n=1 Tax=Devosia pacifica TaxID=1335967 RepID=A0A918SGX0_9HYPH|nr:DUF882 domain-containing protein [Devosia pacifica]GHA38228.1 hypothetical protein GCM10007989_37720 [Devosia pacifica]
MLVTALAPTGAYAASEQSLYLHYTHTGETTRIVFRRNGSYVQSGLDELNRFLRDWRTGQPTKMDPRLFDLIWQVYNEVGASQPINIVSAYRSPQTNEMLRESSSGVAKNSQHTKGNAMDFFIPGVPLNRLRATAMKLQVGGVGYYPTSGSPFVHLDTGNVRAWPRMTKAQLQELFPDGRTLHLPTSGSPLSREGYQYAQAEWQKCHSVPCGNVGANTRIASAGSTGSGKTLVDMIFGGDRSAQASSQAAASTGNSAPSQPAATQVAAAAPSAPTPMIRPAGLGTTPDVPFSTQGSEPLLAETDEAIPFPVRKPDMLVALTTPAAQPENEAPETAAMAVAALGQAPAPAPRILMTEAREQAGVLAAYAPSGSGTLSTAPNAAEAIEANALPPLPEVSNIHTASIGATPATDQVANLFDQTWGAVAGTSQTNAEMLKALSGLTQEGASGVAVSTAEFVAPELEHVDQTLVTPDRISSEHFAVLFPYEGDMFDPAAALGSEAPFLGGVDEPYAMDAFSARPTLVANR